MSIHGQPAYPVCRPRSKQDTDDDWSPDNLVLFVMKDGAKLESATPCHAGSLTSGRRGGRGNSIPTWRGCVRVDMPCRCGKIASMRHRMRRLEIIVGLQRNKWKYRHSRTGAFRSCPCKAQLEIDGYVGGGHSLRRRSP